MHQHVAVHRARKTEHVQSPIVTIVLDQDAPSLQCAIVVNKSYGYFQLYTTNEAYFDAVTEDHRER